MTMGHSCILPYPFCTELQPHIANVTFSSRYLRARKFVPQDAFAQYKDTEIWRKENDLDALYEKIDIRDYQEARSVVSGSFPKQASFKLTIPSTHNGQVVETNVAYLYISTRLANLTRRRWEHTALPHPRTRPKAPRRLGCFGSSLFMRTSLASSCHYALLCPGDRIQRRRLISQIISSISQRSDSSNSGI